MKKPTLFWNGEPVSVEEPHRALCQAIHILEDESSGESDRAKALLDLKRVADFLFYLR